MVPFEITLNYELGLLPSQGYNDAQCYSNLNECASDPCVNGVCIDGVNRYVEGCVDTGIIFVAIFRQI